MTVVQRYGGTTVPYIVVIDATDTGTDIGASRVVYRSGYEGLKKIRDVIDSITGKAGLAESNSGKSVNKTPESPPSSQAAETDQQNTHETAVDIATMIASL